MTIIAVLLACLGSFGDFAIYLLYDQRYEAAAWILPMLAFGMWLLILISTIESGLLSIGKPKYAAVGSIVKFLYMVIAVPFSFRLAGEYGAVISIALNDIPSYIVINFGLKKERLSLIKQDIFMTLLFVITIVVSLGIRSILGLGFPGIITPL